MLVAKYNSAGPAHPMFTVVCTYMFMSLIKAAEMNCMCNVNDSGCNKLFYYRILYLEEGPEKLRTAQFEDNVVSDVEVKKTSFSMKKTKHSGDSYNSKKYDCADLETAEKSVEPDKSALDLVMTGIITGAILFALVSICLSMYLVRSCKNRVKQDATSNIERNIDDIIEYVPEYDAGFEHEYPECGIAEIFL